MGFCARLKREQRLTVAGSVSETLLRSDAQVKQRSHLFGRQRTLPKYVPITDTGVHEGNRLHGLVVVDGEFAIQALEGDWRWITIKEANTTDVVG